MPTLRLLLSMSANYRRVLCQLEATVVAAAMRPLAEFSRVQLYRCVVALQVCYSPSYIVGISVFSRQLEGTPGLHLPPSLELPPLFLTQLSLTYLSPGTVPLKGVSVCSDLVTEYYTTTIGMLFPACLICCSYLA